MTLDLSTTLQLTQWILSLGLILQGLECIVTRRVFGPAPVFALRILICIWLLLPASLAVAWHAPLCHLLLLGSSVFLVMRMRGPLCGGSDSMFFQVQLGLLVASLGFLHPVLPKLGLGWIAAQSVLSYLLAGIAKLRNPRWRNGDALRSLLQSKGPYVLWQCARSLAKAPLPCVMLAWSLVAFELLFPLVLILPPEARLILLSMGFAFHVLNAAILGLNRFIWAWGATYPALLYFGSK